MDNTKDILEKVKCLMRAYDNGLLGGEKMPEHENPGLDISSKENYMYFTLPMALNYQRNSYTLWECANRLYDDYPELFDCNKVCKMEFSDVKDLLVEYKVALQPNKQPIIWITLCETIENWFGGDIRNIFQNTNCEVKQIKDLIQRYKKKFPYLGGNKICNYWLYVIEQYTDIRFKDRENITVAPDTHVIQSTQKMGLITEKESKQSDIQIIVAERWKKMLENTDIVPIDIHTPMWLWSRGKFAVPLELNKRILS